MNEHRIRPIYVPPLMTNLLQPADVCWFRPLKSAYHRLLCDWLITNNHVLTKNFNLRSPGYNKCINWIGRIWVILSKIVLKIAELQMVPQIYIKL